MHGRRNEGERKNSDKKTSQVFAGWALLVAGGDCESRLLLLSVIFTVFIDGVAVRRLVQSRDLWRATVRKKSP